MRKAVGLTLILVFGIAWGGAWAQTKQYVGPENCRTCHNTAFWGYKYNTWKGTRHFSTTMVPSDTGATPQYQGHSIFDSRTPGYDSLVVRYWPPNPATAWKFIHAREYFYKDTLARDIWNRLPVLWDSVLGTWRLTDTLWVDSTKSHQRSCVGCHTTGDTLVNDYRGTANQFHVACEKCHGPGSLHNGDKTQIIKDSSSVVCGQCHRQGSARNGANRGIHGYAYDEANRRPYDVTHRDSLLTVYQYMQPPINPGDTSSYWWPDGYTPKGRGHQTMHFNSWYEHSRHRQVGVNCVDCHNPHGGTPWEYQLRRNPDDNSLCATSTCHANRVDTTALKQHTHHAYDPVNTGRSRCVSCHMAQTTSSSTRTTHNHSWKPSKPSSTINLAWRTPPLTGNPNACAFKCHYQTTFYPHRSDTARWVWNMPIDVEIAESLDLYYRIWWPVGVEAGGAEAQKLEFAVFQNAPNPFVTSTRIEFALPSQSPVEVKIYNSLGQVVRTLVDETRKAGRYSEVWDGRNDRQDKVPAGVYFYKVSAGSNSGLRKLVLVR